LVGNRARTARTLHRRYYRDPSTILTLEDP